MLNRRGFLGSILVAATAPAIVRAGSLMPIYTPPKLILWGDGVHDDTAVLQAILRGQSARYGTEQVATIDGTLFLPVGTFLLSSKTVLAPGKGLVASGSRFVATGPVIDTEPVFHFDHGAKYGFQDCSFERAGIFFARP